MGRDGARRIEGRQPVREALKAGRAIRRVLLAQGAHGGAIDEIVRLARAAGVRVDRVPRSAIEERAETATHQGVIAEAAAIRTQPWRSGVGRARAAGVVPLVVALDGIEDPHNMGAILRSAEAFGAHAVLVPRRRSAPLGPTVEKASAGALEHLAIDEVPNLERALAECRDEGLWIVALAAEGAEDVRACALLDEPLAIVVGSEGKGVSRLVRERADAVVRIPTVGRVGSLNASVAAAVCLWEVARRRS